MIAPAPPLPSTMPGFPDWYEGGFVDIEWLLQGYFSQLLSNVVCLGWLPPEQELLHAIEEDRTIYLRIFRSGGRIIKGEGGKGDVDRAHVQFAALSASRDLSWEVIEFVRQVLYCYLGGGGRISVDDLYAVISVQGEIVGPTLTPEAFRDPRLVPVTFELDVQRRKGLPSFSKYAGELGL